MQSLIQEELSKLLIAEIEIPSVLLTITEVVVTKKLDHARVKVSVIPEKKAEEVLRVLQKSKYTLQRELLYKLNIKPMPLIEFEIDHGVENAARVEKHLLNEQ